MTANSSRQFQILILGIAAITVGFVIININNSNVFASTGSSSFLTYENPDYNVRIEVPSNWTAEENNLQAPFYQEYK
jgi:hypothetical protein